MDKTVEWAMIGRINNNGECCIASNRIITVKVIADDFLENLRKMAALEVSDPMDFTTPVEPLSSEAAYAGHRAEKKNGCPLALFSSITLLGVRQIYPLAV